MQSDQYNKIVFCLIIALTTASGEAENIISTSSRDILGRTNILALTLAETIGMAVQNDLGIAYDRSIPGTYKAQTMAAEGAFDTTLNASSTAARNEEPAYGTSGYTNKTTISSFNAGAGVAQPLVTGGNLAINYNFVRTGLSSSESIICRTDGHTRRL